MPQPQTKRQPQTVGSVPTLPPQRKQAEAAIPAAERLAALLQRHTVVQHDFLEIQANPEMARAMLDRNIDNRTLRQRRIKTMARAMVAGRFRDNLPTPICFDTEGVLRDGQHRLHAVCLSGCTVSFTVCFGCDPAERDFYDQGIARSVSDIAREHGHANVVLAASTVALICRIELEDKSPLDRPELTQRLDQLFTQEPEFELALRASHRTRAFMAPATAALAYWHIAKRTTYRDRLDAFWDALVKGADLSEKSPVLRLRNSLLQDDRRSSRDLAVKRAAAVILAWNAFNERRQPRSFKWDHAVTLPEVL